MVQKIKTSAQGQSLLEFALMLPILLLIVLGVIEFGRIFLLYTEASNASREAARYGVAAGTSPNNVPRYLDCVEIRQAALDTSFLSDFDPVEDNIEIAYDKPFGNDTQIVGYCDDGLDDSDIQQGYRIVVTVTTTFRPIVPIVPIPELTFTPSSRRTILKDIIIENEPDLPPPPPNCRLLQVARNPQFGGTVDVDPEPNCGATWYQEDTVVTLTALPNSGYQFSFWGVVPPPASGTGTTDPVKQIIMDDNYTATANFTAIICHQIVTTTNPPDGGTVTVDPSTPENCPNNTGWTEGSPVILNVDANVGYSFLQWNATGEIYDGSTNNPLIIGVDELDHTLNLEAEFSFTPDCYDIAVTINPVDEGVVNFNPARGTDCPGGWLVDDVVTITAVPDEPSAFQFDFWGGDAAPNGTTNPGTITVDTNKSIIANFEQVADVADLFILKSDSVDPAPVGQVFTYTLVVGNNGPDPASDARIQDSLPPSVTPVSATPSQGSCSIGGNVVNCTIGFIPAASNQTVDIAVLPNNVGTIQNTAFVFNNNPNEIDTNNSNNTDSETTVIAPSADVSVSKTGPAQADVGDTFTYSIVVSNTGPSAANSVVLVDALPLSLNFVGATTTSGACGQSGTQVICNFGNIPANSPPINVTINVLATAEGSVTNQVNVSASTGDPDPVNNTDTATTLIEVGGQSPFITVSPYCASPGESVTINGYNWPTNGTTDTFIYWETVGGTQIGMVPDAVVTSGNGVWSRNVTIPATAINGQRTIVANRPAGGSGSATANTLILIPCPAPDLVISSNITMLTPGPINQGDPVSFRVTVTNTGVSPAVSQFPVSIYFNPSPAPNASSTHISPTFKFAAAAISGLNIGESQVVTLTAQSGFPITGTNTVYAVADSDPGPEGQIDETNETNNISGVLNVTVNECDLNCGGGGQTGTGILAGQAFVPSLSGELLPQPNVFVLLVASDGTQWFTFTDENGTYVFTGLATDTYTVSGCININGTSYFFAVSVNVVSGLVFEQDLLLAQGPCS